MAAGYDADILIRWGDPVVAGAPAFEPTKQTAAAQRQQFGYNCDFIGYFPMPGAANPSHHGLLTVNLEYTNEELMFPGLKRQDVKGVMFADMTKELVDIEMAAHGGAVIEIRRENGKWQVGRQFEVRPPHRRRRRRWRSPGRPRVMRACRPRPIRAAAARSACSTTAPAA